MLTRHADPIRAGKTQRLPMEIMLRSLEAQHREIIVATYFRGRTTREAARELGLAPATASARLYQAMRDLSLMVACRPDHTGLFSVDSAESKASTSPRSTARPRTPGRHQSPSGSYARSVSG